MRVGIPRIYPWGGCQALASALAREGTLLAISARNIERVNERAEELRAEGARVIALPADLTTDDCPGDPGCLWTNQRTGQPRRGSHYLWTPDELTLAAWEKELNNNLRTAFLCSRAVWPIMKRQGGKNILFT